jgi:phospholipase C
LAAAAVLAASGLALATWGTKSPSTCPGESTLKTARTIPAAHVSGAGATASHVFVIVLENHSYSQIVGSPSAPYLTSLAARYGLATNYHGLTHPSLPNYLAMVGGTTFGVTRNCTTCCIAGTQIGDQLESHGLTWKAYLEGLPSPCFLGAKSGRYVKRHDPFVYFADVAKDAARCRSHVVPLDALGRDIAGGTVPSLSFVVPDLCHDMHDCRPAAGDGWLATFVPTILASSAYRNGGVLVVTFDEDAGTKDNRVSTIVASATMRAGARTAVRLDHYSLLASLEDLFVLPRLGHANDPGRAGLFASLGVR